LERKKKKRKKKKEKRTFKLKRIRHHSCAWQGGGHHRKPPGEKPQPELWAGGHWMMLWRKEFIFRNFCSLFARTKKAQRKDFFPNDHVTLRPCILGATSRPRSIDLVVTLRHPSFFKLWKEIVEGSTSDQCGLYTCTKSHGSEINVVATAGQTSKEMRL